MATMPCAWDLIVPAEVCSDWDDYSQATKDTALWLSSTWLWAATGRQYGVCPITIRPSQTDRSETVYQDFPVVPGSQAGLGVPGGPFLFGGRWFNSGCSSRCCGSSCHIVLRGPVADVREVLVGDEEIPESSYRVDATGGVYLLVRTDGECWPTCQDFRADYGEPGSFSVTYGYGRELPEALAIATAMLACEWGKGLSNGGICKLPAQMTRLTRQGVEVEVSNPDAVLGQTGLPMVDNIVSTLNPSNRKSPPLLLSPDLPENCDRMTVWVGGS